jgi:magnesium chelatase family protein
LGKTLLARAASTLSFPANVTLIAAMPSSCGYFGDPRRTCTCAAGAIDRYQKRESPRNQPNLGC